MPIAQALRASLPPTGIAHTDMEMGEGDENKERKRASALGINTTEGALRYEDALTMNRIEEWLFNGVLQSIVPGNKSPSLLPPFSLPILARRHQG